MQRALSGMRVTRVEKRREEESRERERVWSRAHERSRWGGEFETSTRERKRAENKERKKERKAQAPVYTQLSACFYPRPF